MDELTKVCTQCKIEKSISEFHKDKSRKYGVSSECKLCAKEKNKQYRLDNPDYMKQWCLDNPDYMKQWRLDNPEKVKEKNKQWCLDNPDYMKQYHLDNPTYHKHYQNNRYHNDHEFKTLKILRSRLLSALYETSKSASTLELVGCSVEKAREHLESQFTDGMTWENYGKWHIDHIRPCSSYDLNDPDQQRECFNYTNLQPLWAKDNLSKGAKV